jgi:hypothetical protein
MARQNPPSVESQSRENSGAMVSADPASLAASKFSNTQRGAFQLSLVSSAAPGRRVTETILLAAVDLGCCRQCRKSFEKVLEHNYCSAYDIMISGAV